MGQVERDQVADGPRLATGLPGSGAGQLSGPPLADGPLMSGVTFGTAPGAKRPLLDVAAGPAEPAAGAETPS